jgi:hypothetical protein
MHRYAWACHVASVERWALFLPKGTKNLGQFASKWPCLAQSTRQQSVDPFAFVMAFTVCCCCSLYFFWSWAGLDFIGEISPQHLERMNHHCKTSKDSRRIGEVGSRWPLDQITFLSSPNQIFFLNFKLSIFVERWASIESIVKSQISSCE